MVKAVELEGLLQKYIEVEDLERADALYFLYAVGAEAATLTLVLCIINKFKY